MPIIANPETKKIKVSVDGGFIVLTLNNPSNDQILKYQKKRFVTGIKRNKQTFESNGVDLKLALCNELLIDVSARDLDGKPDTLNYKTPSGDMAELSSNVENWKDYISTSIKLAAMGFMDQEEAESDEIVLKN